MPSKKHKNKKKYLSFVKANDNAFLTMLCISIRQRVLLSCLKRVSDKFSKYISLIYCFETRSIEWEGEKKIISEIKKKPKRNTKMIRNLFAIELCRILKRPVSAFVVDGGPLILFRIAHTSAIMNFSAFYGWAQIRVLFFMLSVAPVSYQQISY